MNAQLTEQWLRDNRYTVAHIGPTDTAYHYVQALDAGPKLVTVCGRSYAGQIAVGLAQAGNECKVCRMTHDARVRIAAQVAADTETMVGLPQVEMVEAVAVTVKPKSVRKVKPCKCECNQGGDCVNRHAPEGCGHKGCGRK